MPKYAKRSFRRSRICWWLAINSMLLLLFIANHQHIRDLLKLRFAYFGIHTLTALIDLGTYTCLFQRFQNLIRILQVAISNWDDHGLQWSKPGRECPSIMFNQYCNKALH